MGAPASMHRQTRGHTDINTWTYGHIDMWAHTRGHLDTVTRRHTDTWMYGHAWTWTCRHMGTYIWGHVGMGTDGHTDRYVDTRGRRPSPHPPCSCSPPPLSQILLLISFQLVIYFPTEVFILEGFFFVQPSPGGSRPPSPCSRDTTL